MNDLKQVLEKSKPILILKCSGNNIIAIDKLSVKQKHFRRLLFIIILIILIVASNYYDITLLKLIFSLFYCLKLIIQTNL